MLLCPAAAVNSLTSAETELPFDYYSLPFCKPAEGAKKSLNSINPGTILMGSRIQNSPYNFTMKARPTTMLYIPFASMQAASDFVSQSH